MVSTCHNLWKSKLFLVMRMTLFALLFVSTVSASSSVFAQGSRISFIFKNASIFEVLKEIEHESDYIFAYDSKVVDVEQRVSIDVNHKKIDDILNQLFDGNNITYQIKDNIIALKKGVNKAPGQEQEDNKITGKVIDDTGAPLPGVTITILGSTKGVITDIDGSFEIDAEPTDKLVFTFIGMESQILDVGNQSVINVKLEEKSEELEDVTVVAFGKQKKERVLASIETVDADEIKIPSSNLTTALAGRMSGIISYQRSGEPGADNAEFFIRGVTTFGYKKDPLILIDNIESETDELAKMQPDDIESFSIMKDATATALYGARGANGVILITTKEGKEGKTKVSIRFENSFSSATDKIDLADPVTYMKLHNEAVRTRNPLGILPYTQEKIIYTEQGVNPYVYPQTDWRDMLLKDYAVNQRLNFNVSGGGKVARFYLAASVTQDNGNLDVDKRNNFNNNIDLKRYNIRSNVNMDLTKTTEAAIKVVGSFDDYTGPLEGGTGIYKLAMQSNPVLFPAYYEPDPANEYKQYILFGNYEEGAGYINPYAEMVKGYKDYSTTNMTFQVELSEDLNWLVKGLEARVMGSTSRYSHFDVKRFYNPYYYEVQSYDIIQDQYKLNALNPEGGTEYLNYSEGLKEVSSVLYMEAALMYNKTLKEKHDFSSMLIYTMRNKLVGNAGDLQKSLAYRNMGLSGRFTYAYDSRYFGEFNFGYNGSERFDKSQRFGFFPSAGFGWYISNEDFFSRYKSTISKLKFKATYGLVGNDAIGDQNDRFFYLANVNMAGGQGISGTFGKDFRETKPGVSISRYANADITWETAKKINLGLELGLWDKFELQVDYFKEQRENILMDRISLSTLGLQAPVRANVGEASGEGVDGSIDFNHFINPDWWISARANFTYAKSKFEKYEEPDYSATPWLSRIGQPIMQGYGYIAERLFIDEADVANSPEQTFGEYGAGDIKYRDINGDDRINNLDVVPIGYPTDPEIVYGFGVSTGYKNFDVSCFFQGSARSSFWIDPNATAPFVDNAPGAIGNNALFQAYADDHWSEYNRNPYALWPRLDYRANGNNNQRSTWFMQDGSFLRLKSLEVGYSLPERWIKKANLTNLRFYYSGINLALWSNFKLWDAEMGGQGFNYPIQRVHNLGVQLSF